MSPALEPLRRFASRTALLVLTALALWAAASPAWSADRSVRRQIRFGADMARAGNWREAIFRWNRALEQDPRNARLLNNLAVAYETTGDYEKARETYEQALRFGRGIDAIRSNYAMFHRFYEQYHGKDRALARGEDGDEEDDAPDRTGSGGNDGGGSGVEEDEP